MKTKPVMLILLSTVTFIGFILLDSCLGDTNPVTQNPECTIIQPENESEIQPGTTVKVIVSYKLWTDKCSSISLYISDDPKSNKKKVLLADWSVCDKSSGESSMDWDTAEMPPGEYYLYAEIVSSGQTGSSNLVTVYIGEAPSRTVTATSTTNHP